MRARQLRQEILNKGCTSRSLLKNWKRLEQWSCLAWAELNLPSKAPSINLFLSPIGVRAVMLVTLEESKLSRTAPGDSHVIDPVD